MSVHSAVARIDDLYRRAVEHAAEVDDASLAEWMESASEDVAHDRGLAKGLRRAVRTARKLASYWAERDPARLPNWRSGVDEALGGLGWRAQLDLLQAALERDPDHELFEAVRQRHRAVHFTEWMEGVSYEEWLAGR